MLGDGEGEPVVAVGRLEGKEVLARRDETGVVAHLHLEQRQVAQDLVVVRVVTQRTAVALDRLQVVAVGAVEQAIDVPADVAFDVHLHAFAHQLVRLRLAVYAVEDQPLHCQRLAMVDKLLEHLVGSLEALLVLLGLVVLHDRLEQLRFARRQPVVSRHRALSCGRAAQLLSATHRPTCRPQERTLLGAANLILRM